MIFGEEFYVLSPSETFWVDLSMFLETRGYTLRPRYRHGWVPDIKTYDVQLHEVEDSIPLPVSAAYHCTNMVC